MFVTEMSEYLKPAAAIALPFLGGAAGAVVSRKNTKTWYEVSDLNVRYNDACMYITIIYFVTISLYLKKEISIALKVNIASGMNWPIEKKKNMS